MGEDTLRNPEDSQALPAALSPQQNIHSVSPCQLQPQAQCGPFLPLFPLLTPPASWPSILVLPVVCMVGYWQRPGGGQRAGENQELVPRWAPEQEPPAQVLDHFTHESARVYLGVGLREAVDAQVPFSSVFLCFSLWVWLRGSLCWPLRLGHSIRGLVRAFPAHQTWCPAGGPKIQQQPGCTTKDPRPDIVTDRRREAGDRKGRRRQRD